MLKYLRRRASSLNPRRSLRTRFGLAIGIIAFVLSILASLLVGHIASEHLKVEVGQSLAELAHQITDKLDRGMFERYHDLQIISTLDVIRDPNSDNSEQRTLLERLQSTYTNYAWIGFTDKQGIVQASTGKLLEGNNVSQRPWFINGQKAPYMGDGHETVKLASLLPNPSGEPLRFVDLAVPVMDLQGNLRGVLGAYLSWAWFKDVEKSLLHSLASRHQEMFVLRQNGDLLLAPPGFSSQPQALSLPLASAKAAQQGLNSYVIEIWPDVRTYITGFARSRGYLNYPGLGWLVLVRQKTDVAFAPARRLQQQISSLNLTLGALFAVLSWLVADRVTKPLLAIAQAADSIRQGNTMVKIPVLPGKDETANLSKSLNSLVSTLIEQENALKASNQQLQIELAKRQRTEESLRGSEEKFRQERELNELKSRFIGQASHEFRTPLTAISVSAEMLEKFSHKATEEQKSRYLAQIKSAVKRLSELLENFLTIHKAEVGKLEFKPAPLNLVQFCCELVEEMQLGAGDKYHLTFASLGCCSQTCLDENLLRHILTNLLSNAIKYSPQGGKVEFDLTCEQETAIFCIQDRGIGIPAADQAKLFTSFYRASNTGKLPGTGLGLVIVKEAVDLHGGQITVESEVGVGTTFTVTLPVKYPQRIC